MKDSKYLVWSNEHSAWWRAQRSGYTQIIESAGRYSRDEALSLCSNRDWQNSIPPEMAIPEQDAIALYAMHGVTP